MDKAILHVQLDKDEILLLPRQIVTLAQTVKQVTTLQLEVETTGTNATLAQVVGSQLVQPESAEIQSLRAEQETTALVELQPANFVREVITNQAPVLRRAQFAA